MRFSEAFGIERTDQDDWFDPDLSIDTPLFVDPILLIQDSPYWKEAHEELVNHFGHCYPLVAKSISLTSNSAKLAQKLLTFPEPSEFCLGYAASGTAGSGSGRGFARSLVDGIDIAIEAGLKVPAHIEELGILNEGFGADRISDAACNVLKHRFIAYTQEVCRRHNIPTHTHSIKNSRVDLSANRWITEKVLLPSAPTDDRPIILLPKRFLNDLPVLNSDSWFNSSLNADLRTDLNIKIGERVSKSSVVEIARKHADRVRRWTEQQASRDDLQGYNFQHDPLGIVQFDGLPVSFALANPLTTHGKQPANQTELSELVADILDKFRIFIEEQRGWELLWSTDGSEKPESAVQLLFLGMARHYLAQYNVEVDREVELGRGPVDFKLSCGTSMKLLIEIKKVHNGKFWNGLEAQLPSYMVSDGTDEGWFVAVRYRDNRSSEQRVKELPIRVRTLNANGKRFKCLVIDARRKLSASKL